MMKKRILLLFFLFGFLLFSGTKTAQADSDGSLTLNPNVITNSKEGVGGGGDFPIRSRLFSESLNQTEKNKEAAAAALSRQSQHLDFSRERKNAAYRTKTSQTVQKLFVNYQPQLLAVHKKKVKENHHFLYGLIITAGVLLTGLAAFLGHLEAKRKLKKKNAYTY